MSYLLLYSDPATHYYVCQSQWVGRSNFCANQQQQKLEFVL